MQLIDKKIIKESYKNLIENDIPFNKTVLSMCSNQNMTKARVTSICVSLNHMGNSKGKKENGFNFTLADPKLIWGKIGGSKEKEISNLSDYKTKYKSKKESSSDDNSFERSDFRFRDVVDAFRKIAHTKNDIDDAIGNTFSNSRRSFDIIEKEINNLVLNKNVSLSAIKVAMVAHFPEEQKMCEALIKDHIDYFTHSFAMTKEEGVKTASINPRQFMFKHPECVSVLKGTKIATELSKVINQKKKRQSLKSTLSKLTDKKMINLYKKSVRK